MRLALSIRRGKTESVNERRNSESSKAGSGGEVTMISGDDPSAGARIAEAADAVLIRSESEGWSRRGRTDEQNALDRRILHDLNSLMLSRS